MISKLLIFFNRLQCISLKCVAANNEWLRTRQLSELPSDRLIHIK